MANPARTRRSDYEANRERILTAARCIAAEKGPDGLTVSEVAHRAGINRTTAYQHFRTRDDLIGAVMESLGVDVQAILETTDELEDRIDRMADYFVRHPEITQLTLHQLMAGNPFPLDAYAVYLDAFRQIVTEKRARAEADVDSLGLIMISVGILWPTIVRTLTDDEDLMRKSTQRLTAEVKRLLLDGFLIPEKWPDLRAAVSKKRRKRAVRKTSSGGSK